MYENFRNPTFKPSPPPTELEALRTLSELVTRSRYARGLGMSFSGARDLYEVLGWKREIRFQDFWNEFERNGIGKRVIIAPVSSTWYGKVVASETQEQDETEFEKMFKELDEKLSLIPKLIRLDILAGVGRYGVLLLGFSGVEDFSQPFTPGQGTQLLYVQPYHEDNAKIIEWETNARDPRYGKPKMYSINAAPPDSPLGTTKPLRVHWTRILHVAEGCLENDVFGIPRLQGSFNRIQDVDKLAGGSAEMFWQGALGGRAYSAKEGYKFGPNDMDALQTEIDEYVHGLRRYQRLQGVDVQDLSPQVSSPKDHIDVQLDLISGDTGIPKRLLIGSERGELASSQDAENWNSRIQQRREQFAEPFILRPVIDLLIKCKILPEPKDGYQVEWTPLTTMGRKETVEVSKLQTETIAAYVNAPGAEVLVPEEFFLEEVVGFSRDQIDRIKESREEEPILPMPGQGEEPEEDLEDEELTANFNPYHDELGRFATGPGGGLGELPGGEHYTVTENVNDTPMYHFTPMVDAANGMRGSGFSIGSNSMYGQGVYFTSRENGRGERLQVELTPHRQIVIDNDMKVFNAYHEITGIQDPVGLGTSATREALIANGYKSARFKMDDEVYTVVFDPSIIRVK